MNRTGIAINRLCLIAALSVAALMIVGCASTPDKISSIAAFQPAPPGAVASAPAPLPIPITNPTIVEDLKSATANLDQAVAIGALAADDPAPKCLHSILTQAGIEVPPGAPAQQSFAPLHDGLASMGSILYIQLRQQQAMASRRSTLAVSVDCKAILGQFVIDGATGINKAAAGALGLSGIGSLGALGGLIIPGVGLIKP